MHLKGGAVRVHDPRAIENARKRFPMLSYCSMSDDACRDADVILLATEWDEYRNLDPAALRLVVRAPRLLDARNALDLHIGPTPAGRSFALGRRTRTATGLAS